MNEERGNSMDRTYEPVTIRNATIFKSNFSGKEIPPYNPAGRRNFCVFIDDLKVAEEMEKDGWNIRWLQPRKEGEETKAFLSIAVNFNNRPPKVILQTSHGESRLGEEEIGMLDWAEKEQIDLTINPRYWDDNGRQRVKAYLRTMRVRIYEDALEREIDDLYTNAPAGAMDAVTEDAI